MHHEAGSLPPLSPSFEDCLGTTREDWTRLRADLELIERPWSITWQDYFMGLAFVASRRSKDKNTKHGCVIVTRQNRILGAGYNSYPQGMDDERLPTERPSETIPYHESKYPWMQHSEKNAVVNCVLPPHSVPGGVVAYITGEPCFDCLSFLWQSQVRELWLAERKGWGKPRPEEDGLKARLIEMAGPLLQIHRFKPDLNWLFDPAFVQELQDLGFVRPFDIELPH